MSTPTSLGVEHESWPARETDETSGSVVHLGTMNPFLILFKLGNLRQTTSTVGAGNFMWLKLENIFFRSRIKKGNRPFQQHFPSQTFAVFAKLTSHKGDCHFCKFLQLALLDKLGVRWTEAAVDSAEPDHRDQHGADAVQRGRPVRPALRLLPPRDSRGSGQGFCRLVLISRTL